MATEQRRIAVGPKRIERTDLLVAYPYDVAPDHRCQRGFILNFTLNRLEANRSPHRNGGLTASSGCVPSGRPSHSAEKLVSSICAKESSPRSERPATTPARS